MNNVVYRSISGLVILAYFVISVVTISDYGANWDEVNHSSRGQAYLYYFFTGKKQYDESLFEPGSRHSFYQAPNLDFRNQMKLEGGHPPFSDILSSFFNFIFYQKLGVLGDIEAYHLFGVVLTTLFLVFLYVWVEGTYGRFSALISVIALTTYPLFYGESHYNVQKDIPEAIYLTSAAVAFYQAFVRHSTRWMFIFALLTGIALGTKFNIVFLVPVIFLWMCSLGIHRSINLITRAPRAYKVLLFVSPVIAFLIYFSSWPWLWQNPIKNILSSMGYYRTMGIVSQPSLPDSYYAFGVNIYSFQWIFYTTPIVTLILTCFGIFSTIINWKKDKNRINFYILLLLLVPIVRVSLPFTSIYGGVRQIMEYVPAMTILSGIGAKFIYDRYKSTFIAVALVLAFGPITLKLVSMHPNESVYFNPLIGGLKGAAERNIPGWGNSLGSTYRQGVRWLNAHAEKNAKLSTTFELRSNIPLIDLRPDIKFENRLKSAIRREGEYIIGVTHQGTRENSYHRRYLERFLSPVFEVRVDGVTLLKIWKNDLAHTKSQYRVPDREIFPKVTEARERLLFVDLGAAYKLTKIEFRFDPENCTIVGPGRIDASFDGKFWTNIYPDLIDSAVFTPQFVPNSEPGKLNYFMAADSARFIRVVHQAANSCLLTRPVTVSARGYDPLTSTEQK